MTKFLCGECIHNSDKGGGCLIPKNLGYVDNCNHYLPKDRPIVMTNEEYLKSCTTEQLAEWFGDWHSFSCVFCKHWRNGCVYNHNQVRCAIEEGKSNKELWVEWLKQPHHSKE